MKETIIYLLRCNELMPNSYVRDVIKLALEEGKEDELIEFLREQAVDNQVGIVMVIGSICTNLILKYEPINKNHEKNNS